MKFKLDENFGPTVHEVFKRRGLDCVTVHDEALTGAEDSAVLAAGFTRFVVSSSPTRGAL